MDSRRTESFSDGVFAVAITVLVFNLLPIATPHVTFGDLRDGWPQYAAYAVSFLTIGIMWLNHHSMLSRVDRVDRYMLVINMFLLMGVVAVPFPTVLIGDSLGPRASAGAPRVATVAYGLLLILISISYSAMWVYLSLRGDRLGARPMRSPLQATVRFSGGLVGYVTGTLISFVSPGAAIAVYGVVAVYYLFEHLPGQGSVAAADGEAATGAESEPGAGGFG